MRAFVSFLAGQTGDRQPGSAPETADASGVMLAKTFVHMAICVHGCTAGRQGGARACRVCLPSMHTSLHASQRSDCVVALYLCLLPSSHHLQLTLSHT